MTTKDTKTAKRLMRVAPQRSAGAFVVLVSLVILVVQLNSACGAC
jgi:hypothetical protein